MTINKKKISVNTRKKKEQLKDGFMPAVLYGPKRKSMPLSIDKKEFYKLYNEVGESTLINLEIENEKEKPLVLVYDIQRNPLTGNIIHADFLEPNLKENVETEIPLEFIGEAPAVTEEDGTLVKNIYSVIVRALPQNLPHEIKVDIEKLKTFDDVIYVKDLPIPENVEIVQDLETVVAMISAPEDVEAELEKPIEEEEEAEVIGEKEKEDEESEESPGKDEEEKDKKEEE